MPPEKFLSESGTCLGNFWRRLDYYDQFYSRKLAMIDSKFLKYFLGFWGWFYNRQ